MVCVYVRVWYCCLLFAGSIAGDSGYDAGWSAGNVCHDNANHGDHCNIKAKQNHPRMHLCRKIFTRRVQLYFTEKCFIVSILRKNFFGRNVALVVGSLVAGQIYKRLNPHLLLATVLFLMGTCVFVAPFCGSFWSFLIVMTLHGFFNSFMSVGEETIQQSCKNWSIKVMS